MSRFSLFAHNQAAWDHQVTKQNSWTVPVSSDVIREARAGRWQVVLTPKKPVPRAWFPPLANANVLGLAAAGGQQGPVLAAAGARVTVFDLSAKQLEQDQFVAQRDDLDLVTIQGNMLDLSVFSDDSFDLIFHPCSNAFVPEVETIWQQCARLLKPGGILMAGATNPAAYLFDWERAENGEIVIRHKLPYSDISSLPQAELDALINANEPLVTSHSLEELIAGQLRAGLQLTDLYEDEWPSMAFGQHFPCMLATRAMKPAL